MSESGYKNPPKHSRFQKGCSGKVFLIMGFRMNPDEAGILSFFAGAFFAYIGNRGVRAMFKLRELSK